VVSSSTLQACGLCLEKANRLDIIRAEGARREAGFLRRVGLYRAEAARWSRWRRC
jgi:hypothetical protein